MALEAVAAHLRTLLALEQEALLQNIPPPCGVAISEAQAHFRPTTAEVDSHQSRQLQARVRNLYDELSSTAFCEAVASALQQPPGAPLLPEAQFSPQ